MIATNQSHLTKSWTNDIVSNGSWTADDVLYNLHECYHT